MGHEPGERRLELEELIAGLPARVRAAEQVERFVPPSRFAGKRFSDYEPRHPTQASARARLEDLAGRLRAEATARAGIRGRLRALMGRRRGRGVYLDGGFGVGKTHLLAALWHASPGPKSYLSFDELVYFLGLAGLEDARRAFSDRILVAVDEWELDDPGNLKLALAFLRGALADGVTVAVTSNTLPIELGAGRFSQKDFRAEVEELAGAFEVVRIEGEDYRHRHFEADPGREYFVSGAELERRAAEAGAGALLVGFDQLVSALGRVHPIRYGALVERIGSLWIREMDRLERLPEALRLVHFVDTLYDSAVPLAASSPTSLGELFPQAFVEGPYGKKISRCLSRLEELLLE